jgi:hypothetical protein
MKGKRKAEAIKHLVKEKAYYQEVLDLENGNI